MVSETQKTELIRKLVRRRIQKNSYLKGVGTTDEADAYVNSLSFFEAMGMPEGTIVTIVETYCSWKAQGFSDGQIFQAIEAHRSGSSDAVSISTSLDLKSYIKYRLDVELKGSPLHGITDEFIDDTINQSMHLFKP